MNFSSATMGIAFTLLFVLLPPLPLSANQIGIGADDFYDKFVENVGGQIDAEIESITKKLEELPPSDPARRKKESDLAQLRAVKRQVDDAEMAKSLYDSLKGGFDAISDLTKEVETGYGGDSSINAAIIAINEIGGSNRLRQIQALQGVAGKGKEYLEMLTSLRDDLDALDAEELSPATHKLAQQLTVMTSLMSNFGEKVPLIGDFVKAYGDIGGGLLKATIALDGLIRDSEQGEIRDGVHGDRKTLLDKLAELDPNIEGASSVAGLRDVFKTDCNKFVIWDRKARTWVMANEPGITENELRRRYLFYARQGNHNPTPEQIVRIYRSTLILELEASKRFIEPGQEVSLIANARRVMDDRQVLNVYGDLEITSHRSSRAGSFSRPTTNIKVGTPITWIAPNNEGETFIFRMNLSGQSEFWNIVEPATTVVTTGAATRIELKVEPSKVRPGGELKVSARPLTESGSALEGNAGRFVRLTSESGHFVGINRDTAQGGVEGRWVAPTRPGAFLVTAVFEGGTSRGLIRSRHYSGSEASASIEVAPAAWTISADPTSASALKGKPANFKVRIRNADDTPLELRLGRSARPQHEQSLWNIQHDLAHEVSVPGNGERVFSITASPSDDRASTILMEVVARTKGTGKTRAISMTVSAQDSQRKVTISLRGNHSKPAAGGQSSYSSTLAPGTEITLNLRPWGEQREFCVTGVIERNKNMRQVSVHSNGPSGCSWGTADGRMSAAWRVQSETVNWSGPHLRASRSGDNAVFIVPDKPGTYTINATGVTKWSYTRRTPGGTATDSANDRSSAVYTIVVE